MRTSEKSIEYWTQYVPRKQEFVREIRDDLLNASHAFDQRIGDGYDYQRHQFALVSALYSSGAAEEDCLSAARVLLIESYPAFAKVGAENPKKARADYGGGWDFRTRYLALAVLCKLTPEESRPLVEAIDFWGDKDALWEVFIGALGHGAGRDPVNTMLWPDAYAPLLQAFAPDATPLDQQAILMQFDKGWLTEMRGSSNPFYKSHLSKHDLYAGYWNFEAAAAAVLLGVDDSVMSKSKTYPKDWADWAKAQ